MSFFEVRPGMQMHYQVIEGVFPEDVLFIHGNRASNNWWHPSAEIFRAEAEGKSYKGRMIMAEFWGCGESSAPKSIEDVRMPLLAKDYLSLLHHLQSPRCHLVGHSTGGLIATYMAAQQSAQMIGKLLLLDPVGLSGVQFHPSMNEAFEQMKQSRELVQTVLGSTIFGEASKSDFFIEILVKDAQRAVRDVGPWILQVLHGLDSRPTLQSVMNPTKVLHGEHDNLLPRSDSEQMSQFLPKASFEVLENQGHCCNVENPAKFTAVTNQFLWNSL
jgi:pimeloyl-ACP methyl ester carboxylesterase